MKIYDLEMGSSSVDIISIRINLVKVLDVHSFILLLESLNTLAVLVTYVDLSERQSFFLRGELLCTS